ncbi:Rab3 GTPase-activating protein catalytic subunit [Acipenser ruthenus]|uniref:Rab3 GTPase-activating protein catalytic subunit n=1 Tax=Acipenser ruthenus TaxID=7906 RepID=A0A444UFL3_ACIRT|nr:Rab3 GTPase-activating protein catalytic subunit [Acipenser ruthenus]
MAADSDGEYNSGIWEEKTEEISFADYKFTVTHHYLKKESPDGEEKEEPEEDAFPAAMQDLLCMNNDFPPRAHCLVRWYGVREFVIISPGANNDAIISESKCNLLLSSVSVALGNTGSQVPLFVQIQQKWRRMYAGECQGPGVRTDFEMVHLRKVPNQYNHLSGLLDIFKSKIGCPLTPIPPINIAIRFTYILQDWQQYSWPQQPPVNSIELFSKAALMTLDEESVKSGSQEERRQNPGAVSDFPPPAGREIILRTVVPRPAPYSKPLPQRMFCVLMKEDFRLAGAFSSDTSFF